MWSINHFFFEFSLLFQIRQIQPYFIYKQLPRFLLAERMKTALSLKCVPSYLYSSGKRLNYW